MLQRQTGNDLSVAINKSSVSVSSIFVWHFKLNFQKGTNSSETHTGNVCGHAAQDGFLSSGRTYTRSGGAFLLHGSEMGPFNPHLLPNFIEFVYIYMCRMMYCRFGLSFKLIKTAFTCI